jgi:hypothetical protein
MGGSDAIVPFTLGVPFEIVLTAEATAKNFEGDAVGGSSASIFFSVFDPSGNTAEILGPLTVPEPAYLGVTAVALLGAGALLRKRSRQV